MRWLDTALVFGHPRDSRLSQSARKGKLRPAAALHSALASPQGPRKPQSDLDCGGLTPLWFSDIRETAACHSPHEKESCVPPQHSTALWQVLKAPANLNPTWTAVA